jgi:hypothetical protein
VVTVTFTVPAEAAGDVTVILVFDTTFMFVPTVAPNSTVVAVSRFVPVMVTIVPPGSGPAVGEIAVTVGAATYVKSSALEVADVPPSVSTVTLTLPVPPGAVAVICVPAVFTVKLDTKVEPNLTADAPARFVPMMVTTVPPVAGPSEGVTAVTVGLGV